MQNKKVTTTLPKTLTFFATQNIFFPVQLMHPKLSGNGLLSTQAVQNRSQNCRSISQSEVILQYMRDPGSPAEQRRKGLKEINPQIEVYSLIIADLGFMVRR